MVIAARADGGDRSRADADGRDCSRTDADGRDCSRTDADGRDRSRADDPGSGGGGGRRHLGRARDLGQNFLRDPNILGVIERAADLSREDVVLEVGGGEGVLSRYLAERVRHVHVVELDRRLRDALEATLAGLVNVTIEWGDALKVDFDELEPEPTKLVANLPYSIAAGLILRTIEQLPSIRLWVAMVQREVGERLAAAPGSRTYGASSVLAQLDCDVAVVRAIPRTVFAPVPNVDSVLVRLVRRDRERRACGEAGTGGVAGSGTRGDVRTGGVGIDDAGTGGVGGAEGDLNAAAVRRVVSGAFAHRRKSLARSLELSGVVSGAAGRERVREALVSLGQPADARAERLAPAGFVALAEELGGWTEALCR